MPIQGRVFVDEMFVLNIYFLMDVIILYPELTIFSQQIAIIYRWILWVHVQIN